MTHTTPGAQLNIPAGALCKCGHTAAEHCPESPSPCNHGRTEAAAIDPMSPGYGCWCVGFSPVVDTTPGAEPGQTVEELRAQLLTRYTSTCQGAIVLGEWLDELLEAERVRVEAEYSESRQRLVDELNNLRGEHWREQVAEFKRLDSELATLRARLSEAEEQLRRALNERDDAKRDAEAAYSLAQLRQEEIEALRARLPELVTLALNHQRQWMVGDYDMAMTDSFGYLKPAAIIAEWERDGEKEQTNGKTTKTA